MIVVTAVGAVAVVVITFVGVIVHITVVVAVTLLIVFIESFDVIIAAIIFDVVTVANAAVAFVDFGAVGIHGVVV